MTDVQLQEIRKGFGHRVLLDELDLSVASGQYLVLLGASGCGKTTTLKLIAGLLKPDRGVIRIGGRDVTEVAPRHRGVAMVFQDDSLYPHLTVRRSLRFGLGRLGRSEIQRRVAQAAELTRIEPLLDRLPSGLSGGEQRRAAVAKAIVRRAPLRLFDEPLSALDAPIRDALQRDLLRLHEAVGGTTLHVTHDGEEAMRMADQIAVIHDGRILQCGAPPEIYASPAHREVARAIGTPPINLLGAGTDTAAGPVGLGELRFGDRSARRQLEVGIRSESLRPVEPDRRPERSEALVLEGEIERSRPVGASRYAEMRFAGQTVVATMPPGPPLSAGQRCRWSAPADSVLLFDAATGQRLERQQPC